MDQQPRTLNNKIRLTAMIVGLFALLAIIAIVVSTGMQSLQGHANPTVAAADQATSARTEAKTGEGDKRAENFVGQ